MLKLPPLMTRTLYWPDGTYCPDGRTHVSLTTITTTADLDTLTTSFGTNGPVTWCGCGQSACVAADKSSGDDQ